MDVEDLLFVLAAAAIATGTYLTHGLGVALIVAGALLLVAWVVREFL